MTERELKWECPNCNQKFDDRKAEALDFDDLDDDKSHYCPTCFVAWVKKNTPQLKAWKP